MANDTGTVELPTETTEEAVAGTQEAIYKQLFGDEQPEAPQKSEETEQQPESSTEQPPQETETTSETESETPPAAEAEEDEPEVTPEVQETINKRIGKEVAKRKALEEQLAALDQQKAELEAKVKELAEAKPETPAADVPPGADPLLRVPEIKKLHDQEQGAKAAFHKSAELLRLSRKSPEAVLAELKDKHGKEFSDIEDARDYLETVKDNASLKVQELTGQRTLAAQRHVEKLGKEYEKHYETALKVAPWLPDKNTKEGKIAQEVVKRFPGLLDPLQVPDGPILLAQLVLGKMAYEAKGAVQPAPKTPPPKLPTPGKASTTATVRPGARPATNALKQKAADTGTFEDIDRALEAIL